MLLNHVALVNTSDEQAGKFYGEFLELEKTREYTVTSGLAEQLFSLNRDIKAVVYEKGKIHIDEILTGKRLKTLDIPE